MTISHSSRLRALQFSAIDEGWVRTDVQYLINHALRIATRIAQPGDGYMSQSERRHTADVLRKLASVATHGLNDTLLPLQD